MKLLNIAGVSVIFFVVLFFGIAIFLPSEVQVKRSVIIPASSVVVFEQVNDLRKWRYWSPWQKVDPDMTITYEGFLTGKNASYRWQSDKVGNGKLTITQSQPYQSITANMNYTNMEVTNHYHFEAVGKGTRVTWVFTTDVGDNPIDKYMAFLLDPMIGPDLKQGLANLKSYVKGLSTVVSQRQTD